MLCSIIADFCLLKSLAARLKLSYCIEVHGFWVKIFLIASLMLITERSNPLNSCFVSLWFCSILARISNVISHSSFNFLCCSLEISFLFNNWPSIAICAREYCCKSFNFNKVSFWIACCDLSAINLVSVYCSSISKFTCLPRNLTSSLLW